MWRQGDVLIAAVPGLPTTDARRVKGLVLASGDATGHQHRIKDRKTARLYTAKDEMFLDVFADEAMLVHPEHDDITLPKGFYRVWRQREYEEPGPRTVVD